jgi:hypothetical protein
MNKAHEIVLEYLTFYIHSNKLDKLTKVIAGGKYIPRGETYLLNIEEQVNDIKNDIDIAVWYLMEFLKSYEEEIFREIFISRYEDNDEYYTIICINNNFIKCVYDWGESNLVLVKNEITSFGKIDLNWFNTQLERNFHSNIQEVLLEIKNNIMPLESKDVWIEIK